LEKPDLYLLDEPTNHLDVDSLGWFENYLTASQAGMVVVSHDRYFLDRLVDGVGEIENHRFTLYSGNYSKYRVQKEERKEQLLAQRKNQEREIAHMQEFVDKYRADKRKAAQAQSRIKRIEKIELVEVAAEQATISIPLPETPRSGKDVLKMEGLGHCYDDLRALHPVTLNVYRGDRIAVWGANGAGKSTLLSLMAKKMEPSEGMVEWGYNTHVGYFSQHQAQLQNSTLSIIDELAGHAPAEMQSRLRDVLAPFLFRGDDVFKKVSVLSGGEKSRVALATLLIRPINVLIMDEPLNHLDIATVETLEQTMRDFPGTLIFVSHDRFFVDRLATQVWEMQSGNLKVYQGNFHDYEYAKQSEAEQAAAQLHSQSRKVTDDDLDSKSSLTRQQKKELKRLEAEERNRTRAVQREKEKKCLAIEAQIFDTEQEIEAIEAKLASGELIRQPTELAKTSKRYKELQKQKEKLYSQWEKAMEAIDV
jgi:ATP-binding cassette subfamily F protein 3